MIDFASKVITIFKSDTSDLEAGLKKLSGEEKKLAQTQLDAAKQRNQHYDDWVGKLANINQVLELAGKAVGVAKDSFKAYSEDLRMRAAAGAVSLDKLKAASLGLRSEHELLTFAAQTQHGAFKLTESQMVTAQKAMVALTRAGYDQEEVTKKVTEALVKANGGGLDDFGILVKSGSTDLEKFNNLMGALAEKAGGVHDGTTTAAEGVQKMGVSMEESIDKMKQAIGQLVVSMRPLLNALAGAVQIIANLAKGEAEVQAKGGLQGYMTDLVMQQKGMVKNAQGMYVPRGQLALEQFTAAGNVGAARGRAAMGAFQRAGDVGNYVPPDPTKLFGLSLNSTFDSKQEAMLWEDMWESFVAGSKEKAKKAGAAPPGKFSDVARMAGMDTAGAPIGFGSTMYADALAQAQAQALPDLDTQGPLLERYKELTDDWNKRLAEQQKKKTSFLQSSFGTLEEFNAYHEAFQMLSGAVSAGLGAWIDGSMSAGQAIKKFLGDALKGLAQHMAVEALKHTAYAIGSAAFGDAKGAATHGAAAVAFGVGAAAAAAAAKTIGAGGASAPSAGGASASAGGGTSAGGRNTGSNGGSDKQETKTVNIFLADSFGESSIRQRRSVADEVYERARRMTDDR